MVYPNVGYILDTRWLITQYPFPFSHPNNIQILSGDSSYLLLYPAHILQEMTKPSAQEINPDWLSLPGCVSSLGYSYWDRERGPSQSEQAFPIAPALRIDLTYILCFFCFFFFYNLEAWKAKHSMFKTACNQVSPKKFSQMNTLLWDLETGKRWAPSLCDNADRWVYALPLPASPNCFLVHKAGVTLGTSHREQGRWSSSLFQYFFPRLCDHGVA